MTTGAQLEPGPGETTDRSAVGCCSGWFLPVCSPALTLSPEPPVFRVGFYFVTKVSASRGGGRASLSAQVLKRSRPSAGHR